MKKFVKQLFCILITVLILIPTLLFGESSKSTMDQITEFPAKTIVEQRPGHKRIPLVNLTVKGVKSAFDSSGF